MIVQFNIDDTWMPVVVDAYCTKYSYDLKKLANETQGQFTKRMIAEEIKLNTRRYHADSQAQTAIANAMNSNNFTIT